MEEEEAESTVTSPATGGESESSAVKVIQVGPSSELDQYGNRIGFRPSDKLIRPAHHASVSF